MKLSKWFDTPSTNPMPEVSRPSGRRLLMSERTRSRRRRALIPELSFALCISILMLGACRKSPEVANETASGNLAIQLNCVGVDLRVGEDDPMSAVESLDLYFFSGEADPAERSLVAHRTFGKTDLATTAPLSMSLPVSSYYLVGILNATPEIQSRFGHGCPWSSLSQTIDDLKHLYSKGENGGLTSVVWSNDQGAIQITESSFAKGASPVQLPLTRTIARVRLFGEPKVPPYMSIDLSNGGVFRVVCRARKASLMRNLAPLIGVSGNTEEKPDDGSNFASRYAYSPGYQEIAASSEGDYNSLVETYRVTDGSKTIINIESRKLVPKTLAECDLSEVLYYLTETTIDPEHTTYSFLPSLTVGFKIYPASLDALGDFTADEGWVSFQGAYYRGRDFTTYLKALHDRNTSTAKQKPTVAVPAGYPSSLQAVCEEYVATNGKNMMITANQYKDQLYPIDFKGLRYYLRSYNYYYLPILHAPGQKGYGRYGAVRNNDYRIEIQRVSDYGMPVMLQPASLHKIYKEQQAISSIITLTPLTEHDDSVTL